MPHPKRRHDRLKNEQRNERQYANASAKSKELQPTTQSQRFAAHLLLLPPSPKLPITK